LTNSIEFLDPIILEIPCIHQQINTLNHLKKFDIEGVDKVVNPLIHEDQVMKPINPKPIKWKKVKKQYKYQNFFHYYGIAKITFFHFEEV
jgi:hypothetical protein